MKKFIIITALLLSLQGCIFVAGAAAGAAGVAVVYDHRKLEKILQDQQISQNITNKFADAPALQDTHIGVTVFNQVVLLTGQTNNSEERQQAESIAKGVEGVTRVYNQIRVGGSSSSLTSASDSWITTKIKTQMLATQDLQSGTIKVVTDNGTVYLMGVVSKDQADMAVDIARQVSGVQKVVKIFQYKNSIPVTDAS